MLETVCRASLKLSDAPLTHTKPGNFHALLLFQNEEELGPIRDAVHRMVERAIALDGTCMWSGSLGRPYAKLTSFPILEGTGEHGVGIGKKEYLYEELGVGTVELMKSIKQTIDPLGIFNPGKVSTSIASGRAELTDLCTPKLYPDEPVKDPRPKPTHAIKQQS